MGRRSDIDWEKVQRLYVAGQLTVREIAKECGINPSSITLKAKQNGWTRNLSEAIKELTKAKIAQIDVQELIDKSASESAQKSAQTIQNAIEEASNLAAAVRIRHRTELKQEIERSDSLQQILDSQLSTIEGIGDVLKAAQVQKLLADIKLKVQEREDKVFGLDDAPDEDDADKSYTITFESP